MTSYSTAFSISFQFHVGVVLLVGEIVNGFGTLGAVKSIVTVCVP